MGNGILIISNNGVRNNPPACASSERFTIDMTTPEGKAQLTGLMTAYSTGKQVRMFGKDTCNQWPDSEELSYFYFN